MIPGELFIKDGEIELNAGRKTVTLTVANTGDRPIQVGSHYHFFETNPALKFDRKKARGMRLDIAAGTAVRFEPGQTRDVQLVALAGKRDGLRLPRRRDGEAVTLPIAPVSEAATAARTPQRHGAQGRGNEPYVNHLAEVANLLARRPMARMPNSSRPAGCTTHRRYRPRARSWQKFRARRVARRRRHRRHALPKPSAAAAGGRRPHKSPDAKLIKIADKISNIGARIAPAERRRARRSDRLHRLGRAGGPGCRGGNACSIRNSTKRVSWQGASL